jgi:hypothetical protein
VTGRASLVRALVVGALGLVAAGCAQFEAADQVTTPVHVDRERDAVVVDAPAWFAPETLVVLCPEAPQTVGDPFAPGSDTIQLAESCHNYGRFASAAGLDARLELRLLDTTRRPTFDRAPDWWVVLVAVHGTSAGAIFDTQVAGGPIDPAVRAAPASSG